MGSAQSYIMSPEGALTALVMAGAIGLGYTQLGGPATQPAGTGATPGVSGKEDAAETGATPATKKGKKKSSKAGAGEVSETGSATKSKEPQIMENVIPGQFDSVPASATPQPPPTKKSKKKKGKAAVARPPSEPPSEPASAPVSSAIDYLSESSIKEAGKKAKKQQLQGGQQQPPPMPSSSAVTSTSASQLTRPLQQSTTSIDTDGSWTRVGRGKGKSAGGDNHSAAPTSTTTSDAGMTTTSPTADSSPVTGLSTAATLDEDRGGEEASFLLNVNERERDSGDVNRRTLAEKLLPKPRKTGVDELSFPRSFCVFNSVSFETSNMCSDDDNIASFFVLSFYFAPNFNGCYINPTIHFPSFSMLEISDYPNLARVIRVQPLPDEKPATGFSWGDYEDVGEHDADGEDDGWGVVTNKRSSMLYISHKVRYAMHPSLTYISFSRFY
jgi:hypothetical protein